MGPSVIGRCILYSNTELWKLQLLFLGDEQCYARYEKPLKNHPLNVAKKYVETYSSSNAAAQDPEERAQLTNVQYVQYMINFLIQKLQKKHRAKTTTDGPRMN